MLSTMSWLDESGSNIGNVLMCGLVEGSEEKTLYTDRSCYHRHRLYYYSGRRAPQINNALL